VTRQQLERKRDGLDAQTRWAVRHSADQELLDLLRVEKDRLALLMNKYRGRHWTHHPRSNSGPAISVERRAAEPFYTSSTVTVVE
jgi:hypothetical protein